MKDMFTKWINADRSSIRFSAWIAGEAPALRIASIIRVSSGNASIQVNLEIQHLHEMRAAIDEQLDNLGILQKELATIKDAAKQEVQP